MSIYASECCIFVCMSLGDALSGKLYFEMSCVIVEQWILHMIQRTKEGPSIMKTSSRYKLEQF